MIVLKLWPVKTQIGEISDPLSAGGTSVLDDQNLMAERLEITACSRFAFAILYTRKHSPEAETDWENIRKV